MPNKFFQKDWTLSQKQELPQHQRYLVSVFMDLVIRNLPGTALPQLVHRGLVFEAVVQPEGSDQFVEPLDAARQAGGARGEGLGRFGGLGGGGEGGGYCSGRGFWLMSGRTWTSWKLRRNLLSRETMLSEGRGHVLRGTAARSGGGPAWQKPAAALASHAGLSPPQ